MEMNVRFHGSFKIEDADEFDEHNLQVEAHSFVEFHVVPPKTTKSQDGYKPLFSDKQSHLDPMQTKKHSFSDNL